MLTKVRRLGPLGPAGERVGPGYFETESTRSLAEDERSTPESADARLQGWGKLDELVGALLFLASPASSFVNAQIIYVDGGMSSVL
jgi:gluconate 5-dehydrogenase